MHRDREISERAKGKGKRKWAAVGGGSKSSQAGNKQSTMLKWPGDEAAAACLGV